MLRRRRCLIAWSRACRRRGFCSWSITVPSTSTAGAARPTTRNYASTRSPHECRGILQALLGTTPVWRHSHLLIARTGGNPFFLEESVRTLVETGVLIGTPGTYHLVQALPTIQVPATVQAVLAARIDRLPAEDKRLLQTAAVIGTEVPWPLLQAIADGLEEALHQGLTRACSPAEFLYEACLFPELSYTLQLLELSTPTGHGYQAHAYRLLARSPGVTSPRHRPGCSPLPSGPDPGRGEWAPVPLQAHCHFGLGMLYLKIGRGEQARAGCPPPTPSIAPWT